MRSFDERSGEDLPNLPDEPPDTDETEECLDNGQGGGPVEMGGMEAAAGEASHVNGYPHTRTGSYTLFLSSDEVRDDEGADSFPERPRAFGRAGSAHIFSPPL